MQINAIERTNFGSSKNYDTEKINAKLNLIIENQGILAQNQAKLSSLMYKGFKASAHPALEVKERFIDTAWAKNDNKIKKTKGIKLYV